MKQYPEQPTQTVDESRRRFTKAGLAGSGVILTLASKQVIAGGTSAVCESPSGFSSINTSAPGKTPYYCSGRTPGYWGTHPESWPSGYKPGQCLESGNGTCQKFKDKSATPFHSSVMYGTYPAGYSGFAVGSTSSTNFGSTSMMNVMWNTGNNDQYQLGAHLCASVLNIASGKVPAGVMTMTTLYAIWNEYITMGYYSPMAGVKWYGPDIVTYLKSTMPV